MADKAISELVSAEQITATDLFVLEQNGTAKKMTGQVLLNWLTAAADGHGGIQSIEKISTSGLADTYRITLADTTIFDFVVTNGRSINAISKTATSGLVDTYTISYNNGTTDTFTVTNGAKGDKGDNAYIWIKYASQQPTDSSHSMGDIPDNWIGIYSGNLSTAPTDWQQYKWYKVKGDKGDTGDAATLVSKSVTYQVGDSGSIVPSGSWSTSVPVVPQGKYLWTKTEIQFNSGDPIVSYVSARQGIDGSGSVASVNNVSPDASGNVTMTASDVGALPSAGGVMTGAINMNGQPITGLNPPTEDTQAANKGYVDTAVREAAPRNLLDNSDFRNPVNQRGVTNFAVGYGLDRWMLINDAFDGTISLEIGAVGTKVTTSVGNMVGLIQRFIDKNYYAGKYTAVIKTDDGVVVNAHVDAEDAENHVYRFSVWMPTGTTVVWAAMYEGEYTAETLPEYQPKGYGAELAECQRYYQLFKNNPFLGYAIVEADGLKFQGMILCSSMRIDVPTIIGEISAWTGSVTIGISSVEYFKYQGNAMRFNGYLESNTTPGSVIALYAVGSVVFSADL